MHLLGPTEAPDCGGTMTTEVVPLIIETQKPVNWKAVVSLAVGGAAVVAGTIFGLQANAAKNAYETAYQQGGISADAARGHINSMNRNATLANVSFAVAGVAGLAGGAMLVFDF